MAKRNKNRRNRRSSPHPPRKDDRNKKPRLHSSIPIPPVPSSLQIQQPQLGKRQIFASYLDTPNLPPKIKLLCEIIANTPSSTIEILLEDTGVRLIQEEVEDVLKLSYGFPGPAVKFFRWSGYQLYDKHSPYAWNLVVDLLGKNSLFDAMWDTIKSMKKEGLLSLATFASVFSSYVAANRVNEAFVTFDIIEQYGIPRDIISLNSLVSSICREGRTPNAVEFLRIAKNKIRPDADTYAILLEGWESEGDCASAKLTFGEMVADIGWDPGNVPAYDSYLITLLKGPNGIHEAMKVFELMKDRRCYPGMKFFRTALDECIKSTDDRRARLLWDTMIGELGFKPDIEMYNSMVALNCQCNDIDFATRLFDEMIYQGAFPDTQTYNLMFHFLVKSRKLSEASAVFSEMIKNECIPSQSNCATAVRIYMGAGEILVAIKVWKCLIENYDTDLEDTGNLLVVDLINQNRLPEAVKYAEGMIDRGIKLNSSTLSKLKQSLGKEGKAFLYDTLLRKWKTR